MLCSIIVGEDCLTARAGKSVLKHVRKREATYKRMEKEHSIYYISLLDELHRRTQSLIHSCAHRRVEEPNMKQLDFSRIFDEVENHRYYAKRPLWLPREQPKRKPQAIDGGGGYPKAPFKKRFRSRILTRRSSARITGGKWPHASTQTVPRNATIGIIAAGATRNVRGLQAILKN